MSFAINLYSKENGICNTCQFDNVVFLHRQCRIFSSSGENLKKIKHTIVKCTVKDMEAVNITPEFKIIKGTISNIRRDSLIATAFGTSRSSIISFIESGKVFVNGKMVTSNGHQPKSNDIISVRGKGRFIFEGQLGVTKKGRNLISIKLYI